MSVTHPSSSPSPRFPLLPLSRLDSQRCPASRRPSLPEARPGPRSASASCFARAARASPAATLRPSRGHAPPAPATTLRPRRGHPLPELRTRRQSSSAAAHRPPELVGRRTREKLEVTETNSSELVRWNWSSELIPHIERIFARGDGSVHTSANQTKEGAASSHFAPQPNTPFKNAMLITMDARELERCMKC